MGRPYHVIFFYTGTVLHYSGTSRVVTGAAPLDSSGSGSANIMRPLMAPEHFNARRRCTIRKSYSISKIIILLRLD
jgi:hypothetical protein